MGTSVARNAKWATLVGIGLALFGLLLTAPFELVTGSSLSSVGTAVYKWLLAALLCVIVLRLERRSLSSIGFRRPDRRDVLVAVGLWLAMMISIGVMNGLLGQLGLVESGNGEAAGSAGLAVALFTAATAGITEELFYRGYALERLEAITGSTWAAGVVTAAVFVLVHFDAGLGYLFVLAPAAVLLTIVYVRRRTLLVVMAAHVAVNTVPLLLMAGG